MVVAKVKGKSRRATSKGKRNSRKRNTSEKARGRSPAARKSTTRAKTAGVRLRSEITEREVSGAAKRLLEVVAKAKFTVPDAARSLAANDKALIRAVKDASEEELRLLDVYAALFPDRVGEVDALEPLSVLSDDELPDFYPNLVAEIAATTGGEWLVEDVKGKAEINPVMRKAVVQFKSFGRRFSWKYFFLHGDIASEFYEQVSEIARKHLRGRIVFCDHGQEKQRFAYVPKELEPILDPPRKNPFLGE
jgi:hypothetical protein